MSRLTNKWASEHMMRILCTIYLALLWHQSLPSSVYASNTEAEPPFPRLTGYGKNRIKIVSESVDERLGRQTLEEYHDLDIYKSAYVTASVVGGTQTAISISAANDYRIRYVNAMENLAYSYRPFQCKVSKITDLARSLFDEEQNWNFDFETSWRGRKQRYYGVFGLWMHANDADRTFSRDQIVYSAAQDIYRQSLLWSVRDEANRITIKLYYIQHERAGGQSNSEHTIAPPPSLEMIEIEVDDPESSTGRRKIRSINILSIEYTLPEETYTDLFEPPVGFGCFSSLVAEGDGQLVASRRRDARKWQDWAVHSLHAELEVTATRHNLTQSPTGAMREETASETYNVEVAQTKVEALLERDFIEMIRVRNTGSDKKTVINHMLRVLYAIDMRTGTCDISHINPPAGRQGGEPAQAQYTGQAERTDELCETVSLKFKSTAQSLDIGVQIFRDPDDLHFIKKTRGAAKQAELHYFEGSAIPFLKNLENAPAVGATGRKVRIIHTYARNADQLDLRTLTIWVLNEHQTHILESYLINVLDARALKPGWPDEAKMFDVSEECYLENEHMVQNRDYAWLQLTYPAPSQALDLFASNERQLKQEFYAKAVTDFSRVPRLELLFDQDSFILRLLKLDVPPTELVYDKVPSQVLIGATEGGDLNYMAPDLAHCAHYCRMHLCTVMSFCAPFNSCILSSRQLWKANSTEPERPENVFTFSERSFCDTYKIPPIIERNQVLKQDRLHATIAKFQQQNYGSASLPKLPDEIAVPRSETGLSECDFMAAVKEYERALEKALESDNRLAELTITAILGNHYFAFVPSKFELENDPLREFDLYEETDESDSNDEQNLPRFHQGLVGSRYNLAALAVASEQRRDELGFRAFSGLTYDQCAMACSDSRCGSFSLCYHQAGDCVLSNINNTGRARTLGVLQEDPQCIIAQRDFLRNFDKFQSVFRPQVYTKTSAAGDASECALNCVSEKSFKCLSFEFCHETLTPDAPQGAGQCYYQIERHLPLGEQLFKAKAKTSLAKPQKDIDSRCDHYSRSYLADFVRLESRRLAEPVMEQLKTSSFNGLSVFSCAERCATELLDCTGFQFCHLQEAATSQQARQCTTIESKVTPKVLKEAGLTDDNRTLVDEQAGGGGRILQAGSYLQFDEHCQLFTLAKNTAESQLRDLAFGSLVETREEKESEERAKARAEASGGGLTFLGGLLLYLVVAVVAAGIGCGVVLLKENDAYVRQRIDRLRILVGV